MSPMILCKKSVVAAMIIVFVMLVLSTTCQEAEAARLLEEEGGQKMKLVEVMGFSLESLPQGSHPSSDPSGCTHGSGSGGVCP